MSTGILIRRNEVARETIQRELQRENFSQLVEESSPQANSKNKVVRLVCHKILEKIHAALIDDQELRQQLKNHSKILSHPQSVFYSDVEKKVGRAIKKLNIHFKNLSTQPRQIEKKVGILERMNDVARETIHKEVQAEKLSSLVAKFNFKDHPRDQVINSVCHEILREIRLAFDADKALDQLKCCRKTLPNPERIFYSTVEKSIEHAIKKLDIHFTAPSSQAISTEKAVYPRVNNICTAIFLYFKSLFFRAPV